MTTAQYESRIAELEETIRQLREYEAPAELVPRSIDMYPKCRSVLGALIKASPMVVSRRWLMDLVWGDEDIFDRTIDMAVCRIRRALKPLGVEIITYRSEGYAIDRENAAKIAAMANVIPYDITSMPISAWRRLNG